MSDLFAQEFSNVLATAKATFLDGIVTGKPIGVIVEVILEPAITMGRNEADRSQYFAYRTDIAEQSELARECTARAIEGIFSSKSLGSVIDNIVVTAAAYGFEDQRKLKDVTAIRAAYDAVIAVVEADPTAVVPSSLMEDFFNAANELYSRGRVEIAIGEYIRPLLTQRSFRWTPAEVSSFATFTKNYMGVVKTALLG